MATPLQAIYAVQVTELEYQPGQLVTIYQPRGPGTFPTVLDVHGGAWIHGDRLNNADLNCWLAERGTLVAAIDFRMPPVAGYPASIADTNLGIRWLKAHAGEYGGRAARIGLLGTSSGGHVAMLAAVRPRDPRYAALAGPTGVDASVHYVIACWPILDPSARYEMAKRVGRDELVEAHNAYWGSVEAMSEGNPTHILQRGERVETPPALIIQGTTDDNVTPAMLRPFVDAYLARGAAIHMEVFEGMVHAFAVRQPELPETARARELIAAFIQEHDGS
ncbi:MAG: alpha/beta hydrolase [Chloroflexi bacterium]|nr:alpha/beta hydrolase [Chloroflexota bacterium]